MWKVVIFRINVDCFKEFSCYRPWITFISLVEAKDDTFRGELRHADR